MPPAEFEPAIPARERLQTHALERSATGIGQFISHCRQIGWRYLVCAADSIVK